MTPESSKCVKVIAAFMGTNATAIVMTTYLDRLRMLWDLNTNGSKTVIARSKVRTTVIQFEL